MPRSAKGHTLRSCLHEAHWRLSKEGRLAWEDELTGMFRPDRGVGLRPGNRVHTLGGNTANAPRGPFMMLRMSQLIFWACAMVGRAAARKHLFLAHMWALFGLGTIVMAGGEGGGGHGSMGARLRSNFVVGWGTPGTANKGGYGGIVTAMPQRGVKE